MPYKLNNGGEMQQYSASTGEYGSGTKPISTSSNSNPKEISAGYFIYEKYKSEHGKMVDIERLKNELKISDARFTRNNNSISGQEAIWEDGNIKIEYRFVSEYDPQINTGVPKKPIKTYIQAMMYNNGNIVGIRKVEEMSSKSYANAEKQYKEMLEKWKKATGQEKIGWK